MRELHLDLLSLATVSWARWKSAIALISKFRASVSGSTANVVRARRIAWTAGAVAALALGLLGLVAGLMPWLWVDPFTRVPDVRDTAYAYLRIASFGFAFFGLGLCLYFASQGAGRVGGAIVAQALRLAVIIIGGSILVERSAPIAAVFTLSAGAMITMGLGTALFVSLSRWR